MEKKSSLWGIREVIVVLGFIFIASNVFTLIFGSFMKNLVPVQKYLVASLIQTGSIIIALAYFLIFKKAKISDLGIKRGNQTLKVGILGGALLFLSIIIVGAIMEKIYPGTPDLQPFAKVALEAKEPKDFFTLLLIASVLAPIGEELYFRGILYKAFKNKFGKVVGMVFSGAIFGILHFDLLRFLPLTVGGIGLAYLYEKADSLFAPIIAHGTWNGIMLSILFFLKI